MRPGIRADAPSMLLAHLRNAVLFSAILAVGGCAGVRASL